MAEAAPDRDISTVQFQRGECLMLSEVAVLLRHRQQQLGEGAQLSNTFKTTQEYVERFGQFKTPEVVSQVRKTLMRVGLSENEAVALADLCPITTQEARALLPSLSRLDDEQIDAIIADLKNFKKMT